MKDVVVSKYCRIVDLPFLLTLITASLVFTCLFTSGCVKPTESVSEVVPSKSTSEGKETNVTSEVRIKDLQSKLEQAKKELEGIEPVLAKRNVESRGLYSQLTSSFSKLSDSEREEVKNALKEGNVKEKFPNRSDVIHITTTFDELRDVEASLKKYQALSDKYSQEIEEGEALVKKFQRKIEDEKVFGSSGDLVGDSNESTIQLLDRLEALRVETAESTQKGDSITPADVNNAQETNDLLDKIIEDAKKSPESLETPVLPVDSQTSEEEQIPEITESSTSQGVDIVAAAKCAQAGYEAFEKKDYLLAKEKGETALTIDPNCSGAKVLLEKTQVELDKLTQMIQEGDEFFDSGKYAEALEKVREVRALCVNYPDADVLEKKTIIPMIAEGKNDLERNDGNAALEKARQILQLNSEDSDARELETKAIASLVNALVVAGWEAYGLNDKEKAFTKAWEAVKLNPDDEDAKKLYDECDPFENVEPGYRVTFECNEVEFAFHYCPSGTFTMGTSSNVGFYDNKEHTVTISEGFWIAETELTQEQWEVVGGTKVNECEFKGLKLPVEWISWAECVNFIKILNEQKIAPVGWHFELPTEEQWEYACRSGGSGTGDLGGDSIWNGDRRETHEVATKKPNKWGICDMLGNVWEWTNSKYADGSSFVYRGGGMDENISYCHPMIRRHKNSTYCYQYLGFRVVLVRSQSE